MYMYLAALRVSFAVSPWQTLSLALYYPILPTATELPSGESTGLENTVTCVQIPPGTAHFL